MGNLFRNGSSSVLELTSGDPQPAALTHGSIESSSGGNPSRDGSALTRILHRPAITAPILGAVSLLFFLAGIGRPSITKLDEGLFVPEARSFLLKAPDPSSLIQIHSLAKPPLGKMIMAIGTKVAGDNPFGWRVAAALCGALTLVAVYLWALLLLRDSRLASFAFLMVFLMWSLVAYTAAIALDLGAGRRRFLFICAGVLIGLAGACKWNAIDTLAALVLVSLALLWVARCAPTDSIPSFAARHNPFNKSAY
jgi:dolichyl-phosphate-mannose--protein O-mannosyl transferase